MMCATKFTVAIFQNQKQEIILHPGKVRWHFKTRKAKIELLKAMALAGPYQKHMR